MDNLTQQHAGASFLCHSGGCEVTQYVRTREPRDLAGELLEAMTDIAAQLRRLPAEYAIPAGVIDSVEAAYEASLGWVEHLDRGRKRP